MVDKRLLFLGLLILSGATSMAVGILSPCWIYWAIGNIDFDPYMSNNDTGCIGTVFYVNYGYWLTLVMYFMVGCAILYGVICYFYYKLYHNTRMNGYSKMNRRSFWKIVICSLVTSIFSFCSVTITIAHLNVIKKANNYGVIGYSGWVTLGSGVITMGVLILSLLILFKQNWEPDQIDRSVPIREQYQITTVTEEISNVMDDQTADQLSQRVQVPPANRDPRIQALTAKPIQMAPTSPAAPPVEEVHRVYPDVS